MATILHNLAERDDQLPQAKGYYAAWRLLTASSSFEEGRSGGVRDQAIRQINRDRR
jgi:hypothetical protein